jgi:hypothetical protein
MNLTASQIDGIRARAEYMLAHDMRDVPIEANTAIELCDAAAKGVMGMEAAVHIVKALREQIEARDAEIKRLRG